MSVRASVFTTSQSNPALVLVHGLGSAGTIWKSLIGDLVDYFTIYAIDRPGHGEADIDVSLDHDPISLARSIVDHMSEQHGVNSMHVAGNSLGGWIALEMAAVAPDKVESVTALAPAGLWHGAPMQKLPPSIDARILAKISRFFMPIAYHLPPLKALGYRKITHLWRELSYESCRDSVIAMAKSRGYMPLWRGVRGKRFQSNIPEHVKVSIVFGDNDRLLPHPLAQERTVAPPHSRWIIVENCAHVIMWNFPKLTADFIKKTAGMKFA